MGRLYDQIRRAIAEDRYVVGEHAAERLEERRVLDWQVVAAFDEGKLLAERPGAKPNPAIEIEEVLPDGITVNAVWSWLATTKVAKLVTVHYFDE